MDILRLLIYESLQLELPLFDRPRKLNSGNDNGGMVNLLKAQHCPRTAFGATAVLLDKLVQIQARANACIAGNHFDPQTLMGGLIPVQRDFLWRTVVHDGVASEGLGGSNIPVFVQRKIHRPPFIAHRPVEAEPQALDPKVGFIGVPELPYGLAICTPRYSNTGIKRSTQRMIMLWVMHLSLPTHRLEQIAIAQFVPHVPTDAEDDNQAVKVRRLDRRLAKLNSQLLPIVTYDTRTGLATIRPDEVLAVMH